MSTGFIDWTDNNLTLFVFEKKGAQYTLTDSESVSLENGPEPSDLARFAKHGLRDIYLSLPLDILTLREHLFPFDDKEKINDTIAFELEGVLLGSTEEYAIDHMIAEKVDSGTRVLAVCLEKKKLGEIIELFATAGLDPKAVTSLDVRMAGGRTEELFEHSNAGLDARAEAAAEEMRAGTINLRQDEMEYTGDIERLKRSLRFTVLLALVLIILFGLSVSINLNAEKDQHRTLKAAAESAYRVIFPEERRIIDIERQLTGNIKELERKRDVLTGVPVLDILLTIAETGDSGITLNEFSADRSNIIIKGTAGTFEDVDSLKDRLAEYFSGTRVIDSGAGADRKIGFTILMQEKM